MEQAPAFLRRGLLILVFDRDGRGILLCGSGGAGSPPAELTIPLAGVLMKPSATCPPGFALIRDSHTTVVVREDYKAELLQQGIDNPEKLRALCRDSSARYSGRGATPAVPIDGQTRRAHDHKDLSPGRAAAFSGAGPVLGGPAAFRRAAGGRSCPASRHSHRSGTGRGRVQGCRAILSRLSYNQRAFRVQRSAGIFKRRPCRNS